MSFSPSCTAVAVANAHSVEIVAGPSRNVLLQRGYVIAPQNDALWKRLVTKRADNLMCLVALGEPMGCVCCGCVLFWMMTRIDLERAEYSGAGLSIHTYCMSHSFHLNSRFGDCFVQAMYGT